MEDIGDLELTVTLREYQSLVEDAYTLKRLKAAGVEQWEGYYKVFRGENEDESVLDSHSGSVLESY